MKVLCTSFLCLHFGFEIFWQNNMFTKAAHKMLVKSKIGVNFTNILVAVFTGAYFKRAKRY
jgi:hypothetical protein